MAPRPTLRWCVRIVAPLAVVLAAALLPMAFTTPPTADAQSDQWIRIGDIERFEYDEFIGMSADITADGNTIAFGSTLFEEDVEDGWGRVYHYDGSDWTQVGSDLLVPPTRAGVIALSDDATTVVLGLEPGARVFRFDGADWAPLGSDLPIIAPFAGVGRAIDISADGNTIVLGARGTAPSGSGSARIYDFDGVDWVQRGAAISGNVGERLGSSVGMSDDGDTVILGAPSGVGLARVYTWDGAAWNQVGADLLGENPSESAGYAVSISADGSRAALSAPFSSAGAARGGQIRVFGFDGASWAQLGTDINGLVGSGLIGIKLALSGDGDTLAFGGNRNANMGTLRFDGADWRPLGDNPVLATRSLALSDDGETLVGGDDYVWIYRLNAAYLCRGVPVTINMVTGASGIGTSGNDVILGTDGPDVIEGRGGNDRICAGNGDDRINGGPGKDRIWAEGGFDNVNGGQGYDRIWGGSGYDYIRGGNGNDRIWGGPDADEIYGGDGNDIVRGGGGSDILLGRAGDDLVDGGDGNDACDGGPGNDTVTRCETLAVP